MYFSRATLSKIHAANMMMLYRRSRVLGAPDHNERKLHLHLAMEHAGFHLPDYVYAVEWDAPGYGRGDLVFTDGDIAAVVEVKYIAPKLTDQQKRARMQKVRSQAVKYARAWQEMHPAMPTWAFTYTNATHLSMLSHLENTWF